MPRALRFCLSILPAIVFIVLATGCTTTTAPGEGVTPPAPPPIPTAPAIPTPEPLPTIPSIPIPESLPTIPSIPTPEPLPTIPSITTIDDQTTSCTTDSDCVPAGCCHPTSCMNKAYIHVCRLMCTNSCEGPIDCGAGHCGCVSGRCSVGSGPAP